MKAINRGPDCPWGTPQGSSAQVVSPHAGHASRCRWYSVTCGLISGNSHTWCRRGSGSLPESFSPQRRHSVGLRGFTSSQSSVGINGRSCFLCPGCPPRFFFDLRLDDAGLAWGCTLLGGNEEFWGVFRPPSNSLMRASSLAISASNRRMMAWASGGWRAMISSVIPSDMPLMCGARYKHC